MSQSYKHKSGSAKRKAKLEAEGKRAKLPKISQFLFRGANEVNNEPPTSATTISSVTEIENVSDNIVGCDSEKIITHDVSVTELELVESTSLSLETSTTILAVKNVTDRGHFRKELSDDQKRFIILNGPCQPIGPFPKDKNNRSFFNFYYKKDSKSYKTERTWLCYSEILNKCYFQPCWLFSKQQNSISLGCNDWIHLNQTIHRHEQSSDHNECCAVYDKWRLNKVIDFQNESIIRQETSFWCKIVERIINVALLLASTNMPFRGHNEDIDSKNPGMFLAIIKLLSKYDLELKHLLENKTKKSTTYLSPRIQNEIIDLLGKSVINDLVSKINACPFYSIIIDTTQDISKTDQLSLIYRYVEIVKSDNMVLNIAIKESFLGFIPVENQTASTILDKILTGMANLNVPLDRLRGQGYDGAANMSGIYNGVQAKISEKNKNAPYVHCAAHNLNLVLNESVTKVETIRNFFDFVEKVYTFFGNSIARWALLFPQKNIETVSNIKLKRLVPTRWSSRHDALYYALRFNFVNILKTLTKLILTSKVKTEIDEAKSLKKNLENFETVFLIVLETKLLQSIDTISKMLQSKSQNIGNSAKLFKNVLNNMIEMRQKFREIKEEAFILAQKWGLSTAFPEKRQFRPKIFFDDTKNHHQIENREDNFRINVFYRVMDIIIGQLDKRSTGLRLVNETFKILTTEILLNSSDDELFEMGQNFHKIYESDISEEISPQLLSFRQCFRVELDGIKSVEELLKFILISNFSSSSSFSEIITACILFLTVPVTVATAERSFSKLKLIKNYLRNTMTQERLSNLAIISIENETAANLDVSSLITSFAAVKARKKL